MHDEFHHQHHHAPPWASVMIMASARTHRVRQVPCSLCCHHVEVCSGDMTYPWEHKVSSAEWKHDVLRTFRKVHRFFLIAFSFSAFLLLVVGFPHSRSTLPPTGQIWAWQTHDFTSCYYERLVYLFLCFFNPLLCNYHLPITIIAIFQDYLLFSEILAILFNNIITL